MNLEVASVFLAPELRFFSKKSERSMLASISLVHR